MMCSLLITVYFLINYFVSLEKRKLFRKYKTCVKELKDCKEDNTRFVASYIYFYFMCCKIQSRNYTQDFIFVHLANPSKNSFFTIQKKFQDISYMITTLFKQISRDFRKPFINVV